MWNTKKLGWRHTPCNKEHAISIFSAGIFTPNNRNILKPKTILALSGSTKNSWRFSSGLQKAFELRLRNLSSLQEGAKERSPKGPLPIVFLLQSQTSDAHFLSKPPLTRPFRDIAKLQEFLFATLSLQWTHIYMYTH